MTPDEVKAVGALIGGDGGRAFPLESVQDGNQFVVWGMSMRDYFAAKALAGMTPDSADAMAARAYERADAMLKARERK